jgi:diacylglycerol kinase (ATP)
MKPFVVVNPASGGGRTGRAMSEISRALGAAIGDVSMVTTDGPGAATRLTANAIGRGHSLIIAVGGDGTVNEVVNGFFRDGRMINPEATLGIVTSGTGGDFRKTLGIAAGFGASIEHLRQAAPRRVDLGRVMFTDASGAPRDRHFLNISSFGLSGDVVARVNRARYSKLLGGKAAFLWSTFRSLAAHRNRRVRITIDDHFDETVNVALGAVCNGRFFGGGMMVAPGAELSDGLFDVVWLRDSGRREVIGRLGELYEGAHVGHPKVTILRGRTVTVTSVAGDRAPVWMDIDGEGGGTLPARYEVVPAALSIRV